MSDSALRLRAAQAGDAPAMLEVIRAAFTARMRLDPPAAALSDTEQSVLAALDAGGGVVACAEGRMVGCLLVSRPRTDTVMLHRVSVRPGFRNLGIAEAMVREAALRGIDSGASRLQLMARAELPVVINWWRRHGFEIDAEVPLGYLLARRLPIRLLVPDVDAMHRLGERLAGLLAPGDLIIASGGLGAGKTTLAQGIGRGMGVGGPVISPTFVLSRVHRALGDGPDLVHVDAYRLGGPAELEDLDLEASLADSVTLVEWGEGMAEGLSSSWLEVLISRSADPREETRTVHLAGVGPRWAATDLSGLQEVLR